MTPSSSDPGAVLPGERHRLATAAPIVYAEPATPGIPERPAVPRALWTDAAAEPHPFGPELLPFDPPAARQESPATAYWADEVLAAGTPPAVASIPVEHAAAPAPAEPHRPAGPSKVARAVEEVITWFKTLASAAVYATLIVTFGFQVARVEGQSMAPTLADQDRLIVNKLAYRVGEPHAGDVVMLYYPLNPDKSFVKRVIGEESDQVRVVDGQVFVNDVPLPDSYVPPEYRSHEDWGPQVIPEGYYFVMGDHRNNSSDSRHWGFVPKKYIIGKVQLRWWPIGRARIF